MKKRLLIRIGIIAFAALIFCTFYFIKNLNLGWERFDSGSDSYLKNIEHNLKSGILKMTGQELKIDQVLSGNDKDQDGIDDSLDMLQGARKDAENKPAYIDAYYRGGYPPDNEGVCTDVIWRSMKEAGYILKDMVDADIKEHASDYKRVIESGGADPNIDFRRVPNLVVFFDKYAQQLTTEIIPNDKNNLIEWQGGDIVVFTGSTKHIAIVSDKRRADGVPFIIHNAGPCTQEEDALIYWDSISKIGRHYRWTKQ